MTAEVICDWLDVTYAPGAHATAGVRSFASEFCSGIEVDAEDLGIYRFNHEVESGTLVVERKRTFERVSASGAALARIRALGFLGEYLGILSDSPHNVTRLDAAHDVDVSDPGKVIRAHYKRTRDGVAFGRKAVRTTALFAPGVDGKDTGSVYHGHRTGAQVTARVYDKSNEMQERYGAIIPPRVRYELTVRREVGASLRDAFQPAPLFWHYGPVMGLRVPPGASPWAPGAVGCCFPRRERATAYARAMGAVDRLPMGDLARLAEEVGQEGVRVMVKQFEKRLRQAMGEGGCNDGA